MDEDNSAPGSYSDDYEEDEDEAYEDDEGKITTKFNLFGSYP